MPLERFDYSDGHPVSSNVENFRREIWIATYSSYSATLQLRWQEDGHPMDDVGRAHIHLCAKQAACLAASMVTT